MGTSFWEAFWTDFGRFREAENLDFRTFFDVFSKSFLKRAWEEEKIDPRGPVEGVGPNFGPGFRLSPPSWGEKKRGVQDLRLA